MQQVNHQSSREQETAMKWQAKFQKQKSKYQTKKRELLQAKKDFEEIMDERNEEINTIKESID